MAAPLSAQQVASFHESGFLIVRGVLTPEQAERTRRITEADPRLMPKGNANFDEDAAAAARDGSEMKTLLAHADYSPEDEACSAWGASSRLVGPLEQLFGGPARHYYSILMCKTPQSGGWEYHQDYGYHYAQFLRPEGYASAMLALAPCTIANGCLRVYRGSHKLGRLEHSALGSQRIADPVRVAAAVKHGMVEVHCVLGAGDCLYFHGNCLHASDPNRSTTSRWSIVYSYAAAANPVMVEIDPTSPLPAGGLADARVEAAVAKHEARL
jgi:ectoine hydroxylase-related dioxygenase (phytanoyl-CoA dioxygenase family)